MRARHKIIDGIPELDNATHFLALAQASPSLRAKDSARVIVSDRKLAQVFIIEFEADQEDCVVSSTPTSIML